MTGLERLSRILVIFGLAVVISASQWSLAPKIPFHVAPSSFTTSIPLPSFSSSYSSRFPRLYAPVQVRQLPFPYESQGFEEVSIVAFLSFSQSSCLFLSFPLPFYTVPCNSLPSSLSLFLFLFLTHFVRVNVLTLQPHSKVRTCDMYVYTHFLFIYYTCFLTLAVSSYNGVNIHDLVLLRFALIFFEQL